VRYRVAVQSWKLPVQRLAKILETFDRIHPGKRTVDSATAARIGYLACLAA
jgi:hypothetical protein